MKPTSLPLHKNPAWKNMADYASFNDALAAMRYYEQRYERWVVWREKAKDFLLKSRGMSS